MEDLYVRARLAQTGKLCNPYFKGMLSLLQAKYMAMMRNRNPYYNGMCLQIWQQTLGLTTCCNPCYKGMYLHSSVHCNLLQPVLILVLMEYVCYAIRFLRDVVVLILIVLESFCLRPGSNSV